MAGFQMSTEGSRPRRGFLKPELYHKLLLALPEELRLLFVVAYHVVLRKGALLRIKWEQVDLEASCIWMEGKRPNRKPEPVAVPIYGDMAKFLQLQPREAILFARGSRPIGTSARAGISLVKLPASPVCCFTICDAQP